MGLASALQPCQSLSVVTGGECCIDLECMQMLQSLPCPLRVLLLLNSVHYSTSYIHYSLDSHGHLQDRHQSQVCACQRIA